MKNNPRIDFENVRKYDNERTNIWISFIFETFFVIIPFLIIWVLIGNYWNSNKFHNYYLHLPHKELLVVLISFFCVCFSIFFNFISYILKIQKEDSFTFTTAISFLLFSFIVNDLWILLLLDSNNVFVWILKFALMAIFGCLGIFLGALLSSFIRNLRFRIEEENEQLLLAYENGEELPPIKLIRLEKARKYREKREFEKKELLKFKEELDLKIQKEINQGKLDKLDQKEQKKRAKKKSKKT